MKAILFAAGKGTRISKHIAEIPKCMLEIGGKPLILRTVEMLLQKGVSVSIITGYKKEIIHSALEGLPVRIYVNPFYQVTNSIASMWFAKEELKTQEDILFANADVYWNQDIFDLLADDPRDAVMLSDITRADCGDYFFDTKRDVITAYGKELSRENRTCEYVGISKIKAAFLPEFAARLDSLIDKEQYHLWWENVLYSFCGEKPIYAKDVQGKFWSEIDYIDDYERILAHEGEVSASSLIQQ